MLKGVKGVKRNILIGRMESPTKNSGSTSGSASKMGMIGVIIFGIVSVSMYIWSFVSMSNFVGSKDDWNLIKPQITKVMILTLIGTFGLSVATLLYYIQDPTKIMYFVLIITCLSLGLSFSSLAVAAISR